MPINLLAAGTQAGRVDEKALKPAALLPGFGLLVFACTP